MRGEIPLVVLDSLGNAVVNASAQINRRDTGAPATVYTSEAGATTKANPVSSDAAGRVEGWLDRGAYYATVTATGLQTYTENFEITPGSDGGIDMGWIADGTIPLAKLVAAVQAALVPVGTILPYGGTGNPPGYLICDGSPYSTTTYAALYSVLSNAYDTMGGQAAPGAGLFRVPDLRGRVIVPQASALARGQADTTTEGSRSPLHVHTVPAHYHSSRATGADLAASGGSHAHSDSGHGHGASGGSHSHTLFGGGGTLAVFDGGGITWIAPALSGNGGLWIPSTGGYHATGGVSTDGSGVSVSVNTGNAAIQANTHSHPNSEFSGRVGLVSGGQNGDATMNSGSTGPSYGAVGVAIIKT